MLLPPPAATQHCCVRLIWALRTLGVVFMLVLAVASQIAQAQSTTFWPTTTAPAVADSGPDNAVELGMKFSCSQAGTVTGLQFYKAATNTGTHTGHLWSPSGASLASVTFTGETASGWQQANFATPVVITAGATYTISYHTTVGHYSDTTEFFSTALSVPPLSAPVNAGVYSYGSGSNYPTSAWEASNYWVQPVINTGPLPPPALAGVSVSPASVVGGNSATGTVTLTSPAPDSGILVGLSSTNSTVPSSVTVTAGATTATFTVTTSGVASTTSAVITASYNDVTQTATLTETVLPTIAVTISPNPVTLAESGKQTFTATVTGTTKTGVTWSASGGSVTSKGVYTAPKTAGTYNVTATSKANTAVSASAAVTVTPPVVAVTISPATLSLAINTTEQFKATVTGTSTTAVTWSTTGGAITTSGDYTAPSTTGTYGVTATSTANTAVSATATVSVTAQPTANLIFFDDFSGTTLSSDWTVISRHGEYSQDETECNIPQMVTVNNGLTITTDYQEGQYPSSWFTCGDYFTAASSWPYITGDIQWTSFNFTYGTVEIEAKFPTVNTRLWPATWMLTTSCQYTNPLTGSTGITIDGYNCPDIGKSGYHEIDMTECYTSSGWCQFHVANPSFGIGGGCDVEGGSYTVDTNWHLFTTVWTATSISQYMDGNLITTCNQKITTPMFLIIQTQTGGVGGTPNSAYLPALLQVSYVRVTQP